MALAFFLLSSLLAWAAFCKPAIQLDGGQNQTPAPVGINLSPVVVDCRSPFTDVFKASSPFKTYTLNSGAPSLSYHNPASPALAWLPTGYPLYLNSSASWRIVARTRVCVTSTMTYQVWFDGNGTLSAQRATLTYIAAGKYYLQPNLTQTAMPTFDGDLLGSSEVVLLLTSTSEASPLRNIRIFPNLSLPAPPVFTSAFLKAISSFAVLKFTDWQREAGYVVSSKQSWASRRTVEHQTQVGEAGVAWEYVTALANLALKPIWINTPFTPSASWLGNFTSFMFKALNPKVTVYVEHSSGIGYGDLATHAANSVTVFNAFKKVFPRSRLVLVVGTYIPWLTIDHLGGRAAVANSDIDAFAMNGKFGFPQALTDNLIPKIGQYANISQSELFRLVRQQILWDEQNYNSVTNSLAVLGVRLLGTSGGLSLMAPRWGYRFRDSKTPEAQAEQSLSNSMFAFHSQGFLRDLYIDFLRRWKAVGAGLWCAEGLHITPMRCDCGQTSWNTEPEKLWTRSQCQQVGLLSPNWVAGPKWTGVVDYLNKKPGSLSFTAVNLIRRQPCSPSCIWGNCVQGRCQCYRGWKGSACNTRTPAPNSCSPPEAAVNLDDIADWTPAWVFVDVMKSSRRWVTQEFTSYTWNTGAPISTRVDGYPARLGTNLVVGTLMQRDLEAHYPKGNYTVYYEGDGIITFGMDATVIEQDVGYFRLGVNPSVQGNNGIYLRIERTNPADPIRNVRVVMPGFEDRFDTAPFHPWFLQQLERFRVIRFMPWMNPDQPGLGPSRSKWGLNNENSLDTRDWTNRNTPSFMTQAAVDGVALEYIVQLSNELQVSPWLTIPHLATTAFLANTASFLKSKLHPDAVVYLEHANEVWALSSLSGQYATSAGVPMLNNSLTPPGNIAHKARVCFNGNRSQEIWKIFESYLPRSRVVRVLGSQFAWSDTTNWLLQCNGAGLKADVLALAPYFSAPVRDAQAQPIPMERIFSLMSDDITRAIPSLHAGQKVWADKFKLRVMTYEAGPSLVDPRASDLVIAANRDPRMNGMVQAYYSVLLSLGYKMITYFTRTGRFSQYGCWGMQEWQDQDPSQAPKLLAVKAWLGPNCTAPPKCASDCNQRGECLPNGTCACYTGYSGLLCEAVTPIDVYQCGYLCNFNNGDCLYNRTEEAWRIWTCHCHAGWIGNECQVPICTGDCNFNGYCASAETCICFPGFTGPQCATDCRCNGHGSCNPSNSCTCDQGFTWNDTVGVCQEPEVRGCSLCSYGTCRAGVCVCWAGYNGTACDISVPAPNDNTTIGVNVDGIADWSTAWPFIDLMKTSRDWITQYAGIEVPPWTSWSLQELLSTDSHGNVASLNHDRAAATLMARDVKQHLPNGKYTLLYDGKGNLTVGFDGKLTDVRVGRAIVDVSLSVVRDNGIYLRVMNTDPANQLRNIRVIMPGFTAQDAVDFPFHPLFVRSLLRFKTIRFMPWSGLDEYRGPVTWASRPQVEDQRWVHGVPLEMQVLLANQVKADPWFCIHHRADEDYILRFAQTVRDQLRPDVKIYVEHSNEVWNSMFDSGTFARQMGLQQSLSTDPFTAQILWHANRTATISKIWQSVFGATARSRLVFVLGTFTTIPSVTTTMLVYGDTSQFVDAIGVTTYFGGHVGDPDVAPLSVRMTIDQLMQAINSSSEMAKAKAMLQQSVAIAKGYGKEVLSYEGGPGMVEYAALSGGYTTPGLWEKLVETHRHPKITDIYISYLRMFEGLGIVHHNQFTHICQPSIYGAWGLLEYQLQPEESSPKLQAIIEWQSMH